jgi:predicted metal-dependent phosphoesterase TrpH
VGDFCYLDLHSHSIDASDDAGGTVEGYLKWIAGRRKRGYRVHGFVLTEHRSFDPEVRYDDLAAQFDTVVLKGAELETDVGHVLVYGIDDRLKKEFDFSRVDLPSAELFKAVYDFGGFAVGAHAGRPRIGIWEYVEGGRDLSFIPAIEELNGGSSTEENGRSMALVEKHGFKRIGGSDAHYVSSIGRCLTAFSRPITRMEELVEQLRDGEYFPVRIEETMDEQD